MGKKTEPDIKPKKKKAVSRTLIGEEHELIYAELEQLAGAHDLDECSIALEWMHNQKAEGRVKRTDTKKVDDANRALHGHDFIIGINKTWWEGASERERTFELESALCAIGPVLDVDGDQREDEEGNLLWKKVRPDYVGFLAPIQRSGLAQNELQKLWSVSSEAQSRLPFDGPPKKIHAVN